MGETLPFTEQGQTNECFRLFPWHRVGVVGHELSHPLRYNKDFIVLHVGTRCSISVIPVISIHLLYVSPVVDVECNSHEARSWLSELWHLNCTVLIIHQHPFRNKSTLRPRNITHLLHQYPPKVVRGSF